MGASTDYFEDVRIGKEVLAGVADAYRKLRNTFRYLLGALDGFSEEERSTTSRRCPSSSARCSTDWPSSTRAEQGGRRLRVQPLHPRADRLRQRRSLAPSSSISARTCLYCEERRDGFRPKRRAYRTVLDILFHALVRWLRPVLCFTTEEVWGTRYPDAGSVHLLEWPSRCRPVDADDGRSGPRCAAPRAQVTEAIEPLRRER